MNKLTKSITLGNAQQADTVLWDIRSFHFIPGVDWRKAEGLL